MQQLNIAVTNDVKPLYRIFKYLAVRTINGMQGKAKNHTHHQTHQHFFRQTPLFMAGLSQRKQQYNEHHDVRN
ncbi:Uncharacterised protein [Shigella sonnei]|nr:Uncharacterised protein [Shigella sonnei]